MDESRIQRLERELDYAINQARVLHASIRAAAPPEPAVTPSRNYRLHEILDAVQRRTPEFLRALVRRYYLKYFYYRVYPEKSPRAILAPRGPRVNPLAAHSGYPPFLEFKRQLCRDLSMDWSGISIDCTPGLVSVVLPVYNGQRFLAQAIESVLDQQDCAFELIVVDDGSTDETPAILERYSSDPRVRALRQSNRKLPAALNAGFAHARGEFYTWVSDDNLMRPGMLSRFVEFLGSHPDVEMVYADEDLIDANGSPAMGAEFCRILQSPPGSNVLRRPRDPGELNFVQNNFIGGCFLYRAWAGRAVGCYSDSCFGFEDYDYWMRMNALFRIAHLGSDELLHSYRLHSESLTARDLELRIADRARFSMAQEAERRRFFADGFDIAFRGKHPWFDLLARSYRQSGHNVREHPETEAFSKSIVISAEASKDSFAELREDRLFASGVELKAPNPSQLAYPLLALANSMLLRRKAGCSGSR